LASSIAKLYYSQVICPTAHRGPKKLGATFIFTITSANVDRFQ